MPLKNKLTLAAFIAKFSSEKAYHEYLAKKTLAKRLCMPILQRNARLNARGWKIRMQSLPQAGQRDRRNCYATQPCSTDKVVSDILFGYKHQPKVYNPNTGLLHWLHVMISNAKAFILGTFHGFPKKNLDLYLSEFCFRFNRRNMNSFERLVVAVGCSFLSD